MVGKLSYLGPPYTYSEKAAMKFAAKAKEELEIFPLISAQAVAYSLIQKNANKAEYAVIPYYNYLDGLVQECLDLIYENHLNIIDSQRIEIELSLGMLSNDNIGTMVYSHAKALAQCSEYLWKYYKNHEHVPVSSTAEAAKVVSAKENGLAIASKEALQHNNLKIVAENIGNKRHGRINFTDFYLLTKHNHSRYKSDQSYFTMIAITPRVDRRGLLAEILSQVAYYGLNNAKIHSRPAIDKVSLDVEPQMFYLEIMAHKNDPDFIKCVDALQYRLTPKGSNAEVVRVLGSYCQPIATH